MWSGSKGRGRKAQSRSSGRKCPSPIAHAVRWAHTTASYLPAPTRHEGRRRRLPAAGTAAQRYVTSHAHACAHLTYASLPEIHGCTPAASVSEAVTENWPDWRWTLGRGHPWGGPRLPPHVDGTAGAQPLRPPPWPPQPPRRPLAGSRPLLFSGPRGPSFPSGTGGRTQTSPVQAQGPQESGGVGEDCLPWARSRGGGRGAHRPLYVSLPPVQSLTTPRCPEQVRITCHFLRGVSSAQQVLKGLSAQGALSQGLHQLIPVAAIATDLACGGFR